MEVVDYLSVALVGYLWRIWLVLRDVVEAGEDERC